MGSEGIINGFDALLMIFRILVKQRDKNIDRLSLLWIFIDFMGNMYENQNNRKYYSQKYVHCFIFSCLIALAIAGRFERTHGMILMYNSDFLDTISSSVPMKQSCGLKSTQRNKTRLYL